MLIEKTEHFFRDRIDLENIETSEMITIPADMYYQMSKTMFDDKIFQTIEKMYCL